jgi:hypothetical protein
MKRSGKKRRLPSQIALEPAISQPHPSATLSEVPARIPPQFPQYTRSFAGMGECRFSSRQASQHHCAVSGQERPLRASGLRSPAVRLACRAPSGRFAGRPAIRPQRPSCGMKVCVRIRAFSTTRTWNRTGLEKNSDRRGLPRRLNSSRL